MEFRSLSTACGAPLYVLEMPHLESVAMGALVHAGARDEACPKEAGLAHAFEHMVFRGNRLFPTDREVIAYIEEVGGRCDAFTDSEMTLFAVNVPAGHFERAVIYLHGLLSIPLLRHEDIAVEMQNIVHEISGDIDDPVELVTDTLRTAVYGDHPLGANVLGSARTVGAFSRDDFVRYFERFYYPENFVFIIVGKVDAERAREAVDRFFLRKTGRIRNVRQETALVENSRPLVVIHKDVEQVHVCLGALIGRARESSSKAIQLFAKMIGGGMSFPLFQEVRSKRGFCYAIEADVELGTDRGLFSVYVGTDPEHCGEAVRTIKDVIRNSIHDEKLFLTAKQFAIGEVSLLCERSVDILGCAAERVLFEGGPESPQETIKEIEKIQFSEVVEAAERYLAPDNFVQVFVAPKNFEAVSY